MTYETAMQWAKDNLPMAFYDSFEEWKDAIADEFQTPELMESLEFQEKLRDAWTNSGRNIQEDIEEFEDEDTEPIQYSGSGNIEIPEKVNITQNRDRTEIYVNTNEPIKIDIQREYPEDRPIPQTGQAPTIMSRPENIQSQQPPQRTSFIATVRGAFSGFIKRIRF